MKDYSLKINGQNYNVQIDDVNEDSTAARVIVNGTAYEVEIAGAKAAATSKPQVAPAPKEANSAMIKPATAAPSPRLNAVAPSSGYTVKCPLPGTVLSVKVAVGDTVSRGADPRDPRGHEDGEQHRRRPRGPREGDLRAAGCYRHGG